MNRTGILKALMEERSLDAEQVASICRVTEDDVAIWLSGGDFPIPKAMLCALASFDRLVAKHKLSDEAVAGMANMPAEYVAVWKAGTLPVPDSLMIKLLRMGE